MTIRRILLLDDDAWVLGTAGDLLHAGGYAVQLLQYPTLAVSTAQRFKPDLAIVDLNMPVLNAPEVMRSLRSYVETAHLPIIVFTGREQPKDDLRAFLFGAVDFWRKPFTPPHVERLHALFDELSKLEEELITGPARLRRLFLGYHAREKTTGSLVVNPQTPFEGRAIFQDGALVNAKLGPVESEAALDEILSFDASAVRYEPGPFEPRVKGPTADYTPRVLLVDDDSDLRKLYALQLQKAGLLVDTADNGEVGVRKASSGDYDVVVADLNMPVLDGWGMLKLLMASSRTRELPLLFLSAHDDYRETLRAAKSGAQDYLRKTGHSEELLSRVQALASPRAETYTALKRLKGIERLELSLVGPFWLLRSIAELELCVTLEASDDWGEYRVCVDKGLLTDAEAVTAKRKVTGSAALSTLLVSRGAVASIRAGSTTPMTGSSPWLISLLDECAVGLNELEAKVLEQKLDAATKVEVDADLYALFLRVGAERDANLARAVFAEGIQLNQLSDHLNLPKEAVREGLMELLRRGVFKLEL